MECVLMNEALHGDEGFRLIVSAAGEHLTLPAGERKQSEPGGGRGEWKGEEG